VPGARGLGQEAQQPAVFLSDGLDPGVTVAIKPIVREDPGVTAGRQECFQVRPPRLPATQAGIQRADAFAAVTASDEANVVAARLAKNVFRVPRVVARVYEPRKAEIYRRFGLQTISPISLGAERLAELITYSDLDTVFSLGSSEVDIVDLEIPPHLVGRAVKDLTAPGEVHVVAITRAGKTFLPNPGVAFQADDLVHLAVLVAASDRLKSLIR